jgi:glycosyltransferase involved in cell wall biosynthesis
MVRGDDFYQEMRIVHIGHVPLPAEHPLGPRVSTYAYYPGRWVLNLAKAQTAHTSDQVEIVIKVPGGKGHWTTEVEGVVCHFVAVPGLLRGKTGFFLDQRILASQALLRQPDIVHAHGTEEANALAALRTSLPSVLTLQGCFFIINRKIPARFFSRQWIVERLERKTIPRFRHVITKSGYIRDEVCREFPGVNTHLIPNTYDSALEDIDIDQERERAIAFVGTIDPRKGFDVLVEALSKLPLSGQQLPHLHVFGNSAHPAPWEVAQLQAARVRLGPRLVLHGQIPQLEMAKIVAQCRVLVAPSREEMFGNQVLEALLVGTHVIATEDTAMAENVRRVGSGKIVAQESADDLCAAISDYLSQPWDKFSSRVTRNKIQKWMGPETVAKQHQALYHLLIPERASRQV